MPGPNCLLGVCCPPGAQRAALAEEILAAIERSSGGDHADLAAAQAAADYVLDTFDLAPKDSVLPLFQQIRDLAREGFVETSCGE